MIDTTIAVQPLAPFQDRLHVPPVLRPNADGGEAYPTLRVSLRRTQAQLHADLPPTDVWTYDGQLPGPTIEVQRGQPVHVEWANDLDGALPVTVVQAPDSSPTAPSSIPQNEPGPSGGQILDAVEHVPAWNVVHLHGGRTAADYDGWTENAVLSGQVATTVYGNDQRATLLWYHDHAMGITRFNVVAGLAGLWIIRDEEEAALGLPCGDYEVPLLIQDRNLDTNPDGTFNGKLLHKVEDGTMEFFGPFTLVNGTIWPRHAVEARQYRLRLLNGSNARTYRLVLLDEQHRPIHITLPGAVKQIGTDGGLLGQPVDLPTDGLVLAPAERADLIVDFGQFSGQQLLLVNTAGAPFDNAPLPSGNQPGDADPDGRLPYPPVMRFDVATAPVDDPFVLPSQLAVSFKRLTHDDLPPDHGHRAVALVEHNALLTLRELEELDPTSDVEPFVSVTQPATATTPETTTEYQAQPGGFHDTINWFVPFGATEVWKIINLTGDTHPFHVHLVQFQVLKRERFDVSGFDALTVQPSTTELIDENETGWKDTVRVNPGEIVSIVVTFDGFTGRYMYHCHILEHEDHEMMRPFVVMPAEVLALMPHMQQHHHH